MLKECGHIFGIREIVFGNHTFIGCPQYLKGRCEAGNGDCLLENQENMSSFVDVFNIRDFIKMLGSPIVGTRNLGKTLQIRYY